jgi:hypothetical protein
MRNQLISVTLAVLGGAGTTLPSWAVAKPPATDTVRKVVPSLVMNVQVTDCGGYTRKCSNTPWGPYCVNVPNCKSQTYGSGPPKRTANPIPLDTDLKRLRPIVGGFKPEPKGTTSVTPTGRAGMKDCAGNTQQCSNTPWGPFCVNVPNCKLQTYGSKPPAQTADPLPRATGLKRFYPIPGGFRDRPKAMAPAAPIAPRNPAPSVVLRRR